VIDTGVVVGGDVGEVVGRDSVSVIMGSFVRNTIGLNVVGTLSPGIVIGSTTGNFGDGERQAETSVKRTVSDTSNTATAVRTTINFCSANQRLIDLLSSKIQAVFP
jgi:hypothetical protein